MIQTVEMNTAECDSCSTIFEDSHTGFTAFGDETALQESAEEAGWCFPGKTTVCYCPACHELDEDGNILIKKVEKSVSEQIAEDIRRGTFNQG